MGEQMTFPNTFKEFAEEYKIVDTKEVYTNGTEMIPIFRVNQWLEYISAVEMATFESTINSLQEQLETAKAENERLKKEIEVQERVIDNEDFRIERKISEAKAEAYKEFAERLKETFPKDDFLRSTKHISKQIDNILKELVGEG